MNRIKTSQVPSNLRYQIDSVMMDANFVVYRIQGRWKVVGRYDYDQNLSPAELAKLAIGDFGSAKGAKQFAGFK